MNLSELMLTVEELCNVTVSLEEVGTALHDCRSLHLAQDQYLHHSEACRAVKFSPEIEVCRKNKARSVSSGTSSPPLRKARTAASRAPQDSPAARTATDITKLFTMI